jgi:hypothetical protein
MSTLTACPSATGVLPDWLIIGAMKSGTSTLYGLLAHHPQVAPAVEKEVHFFDVHYDRGLDWYRSCFPPREGALSRGEASPYYLFHPHCPRRAASVVPQGRLIVLLRNPVERAYSHYQHMVRDGLETLPFEAALELEADRVVPEHQRLLREPLALSPAHRNHSYLTRGLYAEQLEGWLEHFPREQLLVLQAEPFFADPPAAFARVLRFLGLDFYAPDCCEALNTGSYAGLDPGLRATLAEFYQPHNRRLYELLGEEFDW